jgi:hypothetical protein
VEASKEGLGSKWAVVPMMMMMMMMMMMSYWVVGADFHEVKTAQGITGVGGSHMPKFTQFFKKYEKHVYKYIYVLKYNSC